VGEHAECAYCTRVVLEDELCEDCGLCTRCCDCDSDRFADAAFDDDEMGVDPEPDEE
jgi:hypothetical protein